MNKKIIRIGMNGSMLDDQPSGVGVYSYNLINSLHKLLADQGGSTLTVFCPTNQNILKGISTVKLSPLLQASRYGKIAAVTRFLWNALVYPLQVRNLDLVISPTTHGSFFSRNQILTVHDLLSMRYRNISMHQRIYFRHILPLLISRSKIIIAVSEATKKDIITYLNCPESKIKVIYNGYDSRKFYVDTNRMPGIPSKFCAHEYLLAVGPTYPHKNFETLIDAYSELDLRVRQKVHLLISGGKNPYLSHLRQHIINRKLTGFVKILGYVSDKDLTTLYQEALALVYPSLYEGFGFPLLEAMACGCPVLASNTSSMPEVCGDAALYFDPLDKRTLLDAIQQIIDRPSLRIMLRLKGLIQCKKFSWEKTALSFKQSIDNDFYYN